MEEQKTPLTPKQRDDGFHDLIAGSAKISLLKSFVDFGLGPLLATEGPLRADVVASRLALHPLRARKWLHLLALVGLVEKLENPNGGMPINALYAIGPLADSMFGKDGRGGLFFIDMLQFVNNISILNFPAVLRGLPLPGAVKWPPQTLEAASHLEWWMSTTAYPAIQAVERAVDLGKVRRLLDAGGGDASMACAFYQAHTGLEISVFNTPLSASLARKTLAVQNFGASIAVVEGDFLHDSLPGGFDMVLWSRVFADWPPEVVQDLLNKTFAALVPGGQVVICEPLIDRNADMVLSWEFRYLFYDDFGVGVYKTRAAYERMLEASGFRCDLAREDNEESIYSVIVATRL